MSNQSSYGEYTYKPRDIQGEKKTTRGLDPSESMPYMYFNTSKRKDRTDDH